jgi:predicted component of type VI protein secretion system
MDVRLVVVGGKNQGREIPIVGPQFVIGRGEGCQLRPASDRVSRKHCIILVEKGQVFIRDLKSTNHTFINKEQVSGDREVKNGDHINVAGILEFEVRWISDKTVKKASKIHSVQEAAVRTVQSAVAEELDITQWLENEEGATTKPPAVDPSLKNTQTDQSLANTTTILLPHKAHDEKKDDKKKPSKIPGQFERKKPTSDSSGEAADNMLRQFFGRKKT